MPVSAVDCVQPALQHTRQQLFSPFRWGQWSRLALVGILAAELHVGGCNFGNLGSTSPRAPRRSPNELLPSSSIPSSFPPFDPTHISQHLGQFIGLIALGIFALVVLGFIFLYISSVFRFILFDSVLRRQCSISEGWQKWHRAGGRFFLWQIVFLISTWLSMAVLVGVPLVLAMAAGWTTDLKEHIVRLAVGAIFLFGLFFVFVVAAIVVQVLAKDFLVPLMALENLDFADGWHRLLAMIRPEKGQYLLYLLLKLALYIAAGILFGIITIVPALFVIVPGVVAGLAGRASGLGWNVTTVSLAIIFGSMLLAILIYLIALVCVPATVFFPAYALHFFAGRYPTLNALLNPVTTPMPEIPPVPQPPPFEAPPLPPSAEPIG
jgi:phage shock protein PspC (stress-responsive transcriptional regulator)